MQVYHDPSEPIVDPETGKLLTSRPTAFGKYLNTKVRANRLRGRRLNDLPSFLSASATRLQFLNVAARHNGGTVKSAFSQDYYPIDRAIDGVTTGHEGWAYHGRLDKALAMFEFKQEYRVSRFRLLSGVGRFTDHHVTAFQVSLALSRSLSRALSTPLAGPPRHCTPGVIRERDRVQAAQCRRSQSSPIKSTRT